MSRMHISTRDDAPAASKPLLDALYRKLGIVPNYARLLASSPAALQAFSAFREGLAKTLNPKTRQRIALAVSQVNMCGYCLSAHTYLATNFAKLPPDEVALNRLGSSNDPKARAAVEFAVAVAQKRGHIDDGDVASVKAAGFNEAAIVDIVALVAETTFLNYLNKVADTNVDFPTVTIDAHQMPFSGAPPL